MDYMNKTLDVLNVNREKNYDLIEYLEKLRSHPDFDRIHQETLKKL